jgi:hypothetical protein
MPLVCESLKSRGEAKDAVPNGSQQPRHQVDHDARSAEQDEEIADGGTQQPRHQVDHYAWSAEQDEEMALFSEFVGYDLLHNNDFTIPLIPDNNFALSSSPSRDTCSVQEFNSLTFGYDTEADKVSLQQRYDDNLLFPRIEFKNKTTPESIEMDFIYPVNDKDRNSFRVSKEKKKNIGTQSSSKTKIPTIDDEFLYFGLRKKMYDTGYEHYQFFLTCFFTSHVQFSR